MPFVITSGLRFFEQAHVKDLVAQLRFVINPKDRTAFYRFICLLPKVEKTAAKLLKLVEKQADSLQKNIFDVFADPSIFSKVPADAKDDWLSITETLQNIHILSQSATPAQVVEGAICGWYQDYLKEPTKIGPGGKKILKAWLILQRNIRI